MATKKKATGKPKARRPAISAVGPAQNPPKRRRRMAGADDVPQNEDALPVARILPRANVTTGKPSKLAKVGNMRTKVAYGSASSFTGNGVSQGTGGNTYSPEMSTDFLELPQGSHEQWNFYRFFYRTEPFVGQAIDLHTELPLSKVRLGMPKAKNRELAEAAMRFCTKWAKRVDLLQRLLEIVHEYYLIGEVFIFCEDKSPEMPDDVRHEVVRVIEGEELREELREREDADERAVRWLKKNYHGWTHIRILPPEQVQMEAFNGTDEKLFDFVVDSKTKDIIGKADAGDKRAQQIVDSYSPDIVEAVRKGENVPLNTDPDAGSFIHYLARKRSQYQPRGSSILERVLRVLVFRDKLRQANTSIASRHMTPIRVVYGEDMDAHDVDFLRDQVDLALMDPDFSIIANFPITWEEMGSEQRLLDLTSEYDLTDRQLYAGLGVTESLLSGEAAYSGDRINLEVINTRYMLLRETLQNFVEEHIFKPMCARMGFIEVDEDGDEIVIYPTLSFTRLALRDNSDTFDAMFNLYQKGSLDVDTIYELLNLDPIAVREKIKEDMLTVNDAVFNELFRTIYGEVGRMLSENSDIAEKIAKEIGVKYKKPDPNGGRF